MPAFAGMTIIHIIKFVFNHLPSPPRRRGSHLVFINLNCVIVIS